MFPGSWRRRRGERRAAGSTAAAGSDVDLAVRLCDRGPVQRHDRLHKPRGQVSIRTGLDSTADAGLSASSDYHRFQCASTLDIRHVYSVPAPFWNCIVF